MTEYPAGPSPHNQGTCAPTSTGLEPHVAAVLCYLLGPVSGLVILVVEKRNVEVQFHAAQSAIFGVVVFTAWLILSETPWLPLFSLLAYAVTVLLWMTALTVWISLMVGAVQLKHVKLPVIGTIAERMSAV
ncbi:MAG: DUF4870 domain-containing protein [Haloechinothrix sp.]